MISTNTEEDYSLATNKLGMEPSDPPSSSLSLEPRHPTMIIMWGHVVRLEIERHLDKKTKQ